MDVLRRFYNSPLWGIPRKLGIDDRIADVYWSAKVATTPERTVTVADTDAIIRVHNKPECQRAVTLNREGPFIKAIFEELEAEDVFVDVGANIGLISTLAAHHCSEVIAFEPAPGNVQRFKTNMQLSGVGDKYTIEQAALGAISGTTRLRLHGPKQAAGNMNSTSRAILRCEFVEETTTSTRRQRC